MNALRLFTACVFASLATIAWAQYPARPVRLIVPFPPGGGTDLLARGLAERAAAEWGQPVVVDNRPGGGTVIGTEIVAKAAPDGYTLVMASFAHAANASLLPKLPFDPVADFTAIGMVAFAPHLLLANPKVEASDVAALISLAKRRPGRLTFASFGNGTSAHLAGELFRSMAGIELVHVPYKGSAPAMTDLVGGQVDLVFDSLQALPQVRQGRLRALGLAAPARSTTAPDIPTIAESGLPGFASGSWFGLLGPKGLAAGVVAKWNDAVNRAVASASFRERLASIGFEPAGGTPEAMTSYVRAEMEKWSKVVRDNRITAE